MRWVVIPAVQMENQWGDILSTVLSANVYRSLDKGSYSKRIQEVIDEPVTEAEFKEAFTRAKLSDDILHEDFVYWYSVDNTRTDVETYIGTVWGENVILCEHVYCKVTSKELVDFVDVPWERYLESDSHAFIGFQVDPIRKERILLSRIAALEVINPNLYAFFKEELHKRTATELALLVWPKPLGVGDRIRRHEDNEVLGAIMTVYPGKFLNDVMNGL